VDTLIDIKSQLGNRKICLGRELTKRFEEYIRGTVDEVMEWTKVGVIKGEFCIVIDGEDPDREEIAVWWEEVAIVDHVDYYIKTDKLTSKDAIKQVALERKVPKREIYQSYHLDIK